MSREPARHPDLAAAAVAAVSDGRLSAREAELLVGFVACHDAGLESPSRATFYRRAEQLRALGFEPPALPEGVARGELPPRERRRVPDRRRGDRRGPGRDVDG